MLRDLDFSETHGFPTFAMLTAFLYGKLPFPDPFTNLGPYKTKSPNRVFVLIVAGPRFELGSRGYEPRELPLLHPAILQ